MTNAELRKIIKSNVQSWNNYDFIVDAVEAYSAALLQQANVMRWVAFDDMKPEYMQCCLITDKCGFVTEAQYAGEANIFTVGEERYEAKAWMELPPPVV